MRRNIYIITEDLDKCPWYAFRKRQKLSKEFREKIIHCVGENTLGLKNLVSKAKYLQNEVEKKSSSNVSSKRRGRQW